MSNQNKPKLRFSSKIVVASVSAVLFYTCFIFFLELLNIKYGTNIQVPVDLTAAWYAFWTVELVCLASIRKTKIKNKYEYDDVDRQMSSIDLANKLQAFREGKSSSTSSPQPVHMADRSSLDESVPQIEDEGTDDITFREGE